MGPDDAVILVTHQPRWLAEWFWEATGAHNLRQLVRGSLRGRARVHLAGAPNPPHEIGRPVAIAETVRCMGSAATSDFFSILRVELSDMLCTDCFVCWRWYGCSCRYVCSYAHIYVCRLSCLLGGHPPYPASRVIFVTWLQHLTSSGSHRGPALLHAALLPALQACKPSA